MMFQIKNEKDGYLLEVHTDLLSSVEGYFQWVPLRKFELQGDAFLYRDSWAPKLTDLNIKHLAKHYNPNQLFGMRRAGVWGVVREINSANT